MTSLLAAPPDDLQGAQRPRICHVPPADGGSGLEAIELARMAGLELDPWQEYVLAQSLGERADGSWAAFEVGLVVSRQNGKGSVLEARELAGLFLLDERLLIHSAHQFDTSLEAFRRLLQLIEDTPDLDRRVQRVSKSHGEEGIELKKNPRTGLRQRIRFRTRTKGGGRGFTGDLLVLDEAMILPESAHGALLPTLSARPNPQVWYTASAVDQDVHEHGVVLTRVRERGVKGEDPGLAYFEFSVDKTVLDEHPELAADPAMWAEGNPGLGIRITSEHVAREQRSMDPKTFAVERLGAGDWPDLSVIDADGISLESFNDTKIDADDAELPANQALNPICFALDVRPNRTAAAIGAAGNRTDGLPHIEVVEHRKGTDWVVERLVELTQAHQYSEVIYDKASPAASLVADLEAAGIKLRAIGAQELGQACGRIFDAFSQRAIRHLGTAELDAAIRGAAKRPLGDAWAWSRRASTVDICPLVAVTLALWGNAGSGPSAYEDHDLIVL
jgi:hypothetical protein